MVQPGTETKMGRTDDLLEENYIYKKEQQFTIDAICEDLERAGYSVQPFVIPACAVGAPHRRDRVWIVAHRTDAGVENLQQGWKDGISQSFFTSNTQCFGGHKVENKIQCEQSNGERIDGNGMFRTSFNTNGKGWNALRYDDGYSEAAQQVESQFGRADCPQSWWRNFPTQSPVCNRDDGLPFKVANLTLSLAKWRSKSIEALGNAWVPQVVFEIFKAIDFYDKNNKV